MRDKLRALAPAAALLALLGACASNIGVSSTGGTVSAHLDSVTIDSAPTGRMVCPIDEIRRIDYRRMTADLRAKAQQTAAAPQDFAAQPHGAPPSTPAPQPNPAPPPH